MDDPNLLSNCHHAPQHFPERAPAMLHAVADGALTAWVITYGTSFEGSGFPGRHYPFWEGGA